MTVAEHTFDASQSDQISIDTPRIYLAAPRRNVDLSRVTLGIVAELKRREVGVAAAKIGPSLVEPTHYRRISGRLCHSLDPWMLSQNQLIESFARLSSGTELLVIEGECGLYDQRDEDFHLKRDADIASLLRAPIVLVVDASDSFESIAALVQGFANYDRSTNLLGVIATNVMSGEQNSRIAAAINQLVGISYLGGIPLDPAEYAETQNDNPSSLTRSYVVALRDMICNSIDTEALWSIARNAGSLTVSSGVVGSKPRCCRIAVADDAGFHLCVQDNLDLIRRSGAELSAFSPLADMKLPPDIWGLYLPSGYIHIYGEEAMRNNRMVSAIQSFVRKGGILYAEGAALPYLCREFAISEGVMIRGVGVMPAVAETFTSDLVDKSARYYHVLLDDNTPLGSSKSSFRAVATRRLMIRPDAQMPCWSVAQSRSEPGCGEDADDSVLLQGFLPKPNVLLNQVHGHWGSKPEISEAFVAQVVEAQQTHADTNQV